MDLVHCVGSRQMVVVVAGHLSVANAAQRWYQALVWSVHRLLTHVDWNSVEARGAELVVQYGLALWIALR